jgi:hypothetical protein
MNFATGSFVSKRFYVFTEVKICVVELWILMPGKWLETLQRGMSLASG